MRLSDPRGGNKAAFEEREIPQIAVINEATAIADADVQKMLPAFEQQWNRDLLPVWGDDTATFAFVPQ
jgi:hypothetical protein